MPIFALHETSATTWDELLTCQSNKQRHPLPLFCVVVFNWFTREFLGGAMS